MNSNTKSDNKSSAISIIFIFFILASIFYGGANGKMKEVTDASFTAAKSAVNLSIGLIGIMALWLGLMRILEAGGLILSIARGLKPIMSWLFPEVPINHPAMGAMILNISANMLGLGNAATPFGLKAMKELDKLNPVKGTASNAMCLFLAINTSSIALLPLGVIGVRAAAGASSPEAIWIPSTIATLCSTLVAVFAAKFFATKEERTNKDLNKEEVEIDNEINENYEKFLKKPNIIEKQFVLISVASLVLCFFISKSSISDLPTWLLPTLMLLIVSYGVSRGVKIYEAVTDGAKQGFDLAIRIIPFLVVILVAIGMFRASGAMQFGAKILNPLTSLIWMPAEVLPMAIVRPLSGTGAFGVMSEIINNAPDSYSSYLASVIMGSTETTFYVLAVYFGSVGITKVRHAVVAAILADITGVVASCFLTKIFY